MKIRKLFVLVISLAVLIVASLPVSFAVDPITSQLVEPVPVLETVNGQKHLRVATVCYGGLVQGKYNLAIADLYTSANANFYILPNVTYVCDQPFNGTLIVYDVESGNLIYQTSFNITGVSHDDGYYKLKDYYCMPVYHSSGSPRDVFLIRPDNIELKYNIYVRSDSWVEPYVIWAISTPDQNQYRSPLSEPIADQFNSYMVIDNHLIWVSYRVNGIYTRNNSIESVSELYSQSVQISESGTGNYSGSSNGYTEDVSVPDGMFNYWSAPNQTSSGVYRGFDLGNIDFSSVNQGSVHFNSSGSVTFNDIEYYPVSFSQSDVLSLYRIYCIPTDTDNFVFWLAPDRSLAQNTIVNMDFFFSEFDLEGNYIKSSFHSVTNTDLGLFDSYQSEEDISSIRCYGIDFYNLNNLPFNFSSVLWEYDFDFAQWRDDVKQLLQSIYNTLSQDPSAPAPETYPDYAGEIPSVEIVSGASPEDAGNLFGRSQNIVPQESIFAINQWRDFFNIPDLIGACMFALTVGTIIIILGKRKSE